METKAEFSKYEVLPIAHSFLTLVRIMSIVLGFISKTGKGRRILAALLREGHLWFEVFNTHISGAGTHLENAQSQTR